MKKQEYLVERKEDSTVEILDIEHTFNLFVMWARKPGTVLTELYAGRFEYDSPELKVTPIKRIEHHGH